MEGNIPEQRMKRLFELASERVEEDREDSWELADRYVELARKIGMKHNVSIPSELRKQFCAECSSFLVVGRNCRVRVNSKKRNINYRCEECGNVNRHGY